MRSSTGRAGTVSTRCSGASHHVDFIGGTPTPIVPAVASIERVESPFASGITIRYAEGTPWHETTILLPRAQVRVEIHNIIDRGKMRKVPYDEHSDHFYFAFPLALSTRQLSANYLGATRFQSLKDVLPGANANGIVSLGAVDLRDALWGVTVAHRGAFSFSVGGIGQSSALFQPVEATLFAHVVQKADEGKTKDKGITAFEVEPGAPNLLRFAFAFEVSDGEFDPVAASRFALEYVMSPLAWVGAACWQFRRDQPGRGPSTVDRPQPGRRRPAQRLGDGFEKSRSHRRP